MPLKVKTTGGLVDIAGLKIKTSEGLVDAQKLLVKTSNGLETVWTAEPSAPSLPPEIPAGIDPLILTVQTDIDDPNDRTFVLPGFGSIDWIVDWGDEKVTRVQNASLCVHTYATPDTYTIKIYPYNVSTAWLQNFGFYSEKTTGWSGITAQMRSQANRNKVIGVDGLLVPKMFATDEELAEGKVRSNVCESWFAGCTNIEMSDTFTFSGWENITEVGGAFCYKMFMNCSGDQFKMGLDFNLPQHIQRIGGSGARSQYSDSTAQKPSYAFCNCMFYGCSGENFNMNDVFTLPQTLIMTGAWFCTSMFYGCSGDAFNMGTMFNLPQNITNLRDPDGGDAALGHVCQHMFKDCSGDAFTMNEDFQLPQGLIHGQCNTFHHMFLGCNGAAFNMNEKFNLPQAMTDTNYSFAVSMFQDCNGAAFTMNEVFNAPPLMRHDPTDATGFLYGLFYNCSGASFLVNDVFTFPTLSLATLDASGSKPFDIAFYNCKTTQTRTAASIIGDNPTPSEPRGTFRNATGFTDLENINANWKGATT